MLLPEPPYTVLVAEDSPLSQIVIEHVLQHFGYSVDLVADGQAALDKLHQHQYDVVLLDIHMPVLNGIETARAIRRQFSPHRQPLIIALTANTRPHDCEQYLAAGMDDYLSKPFQFDALQQKLQEHLNPRHPKPRTPAPSSQCETIEWSVLEEYAATFPAHEQTKELTHLITSFAGQVPAVLQQLQQGTTVGDAAMLHRAAHNLVSMSGLVGAQQLVTRARHLAEQTRAGYLDDVESQVHQIIDCYHQVVAMLQSTFASTTAQKDPCAPDLALGMARYYHA
ncbi:MAG: response regulator [Blastochloris sp.]|nr:response regulator [Blastochloris sp.]